MPTVVLNTDPKFGPVEHLEEVRMGWMGVRSYRVNTADAFRAITAEGVPKKGDAWGSGALSELRVVDRQSRYFCGRDIVGDPPETGGTTVITVRYETPGIYGRLPIAEVGGNYTKIEVDESVETRLFSVDPALTAKIGTGGEGVPVGVGRIRAEVYTFWNPEDPIKPHPDWSQMNSLARRHKLNDDAITLPPLLGRNGVVFEIPANQAQYVSYRAAMVDGVLEVVHVLNIAEDFLATWEVEDSRGRKLGVFRSALVYVNADFSGLW